jgi:hypothetical protein
VCGFFLIYVVPLGLHFGCYYPKTSLKVSESEEKSGLSAINEALVNDRTVMTDYSVIACNDHPTKNRLPKSARLVLYGLILGVGLFNMGISLKDLFGI